MIDEGERGMAALDEISLTLGELKAMASASAEGRRALHDKVDRVAVDVAALKTQMATLQQTVQSLSETQEAHEGDITTFRQQRDMGRGAIAAFSGLAGLGGGGFGAWLLKWLSGPTP